MFELLENLKFWTTSLMSHWWGMLSLVWVWVILTFWACRGKKRGKFVWCSVRSSLDSNYMSHHGLESVVLQTLVVSCVRFSLCSVPHLHMFSSNCSLSFPFTHMFTSDCVNTVLYIIYLKVWKTAVTYVLNGCLHEGRGEQLSWNAFL